jgi:putative NADH-flavin reductase
MKVLILGASGRTGRQVLAAAMEAGHEVRCLVRNASKLRNLSDSIEIVEGSIQDEENLKQALEGREAVLSALNLIKRSGSPWSKVVGPYDIISDVIQKLCNLSDPDKLQRIIVCSAHGTNETKQDMPAWFRWLVDNSKIKHAYMDHEKQEDVLRRSKHKWTIVRPVGLTNKERLEEIDEVFNREHKLSMMISRKTVGKYMVDALGRDDLIGKAPSIAKKKS